MTRPAEEGRDIPPPAMGRGRGPMSTQRWKRQEREIAAALGGVRLPNSGRGQPDVIAGNLAVQVKTRATLPAWLITALDQAARDAAATGPDALPVVVLSAVMAGRKARRLVVLDLDAFVAVRVPE